MHRLITGRTGSGKTTLAVTMAAEYQRRGLSTLCLDITQDPRWPIGNGIVTADQAEFLDFFWGSRNCEVFIEEAHEVVGLWNRELVACLTRGRHQGHETHLISQRIRGLSPTALGQCEQFFIFRVGPRDAETLAEETCCEQLKRAWELKTLTGKWADYYQVDAWGPDGSMRCELKRLFFEGR